MDNAYSPSDSNVLKEKGFCLDKVIGEGSYAKVYKSTYIIDETHTVTLACKIIDTSKAPKEYLNKFLPREMDILIRTNHPHIVHICGIFQRRAKYFVFLRYAENGDLLDFITSNGAISEDQCRLWIRQICLALEYLHTMQIAHRDLKCENVLITSNYNVKITDFGFARVVRVKDIEVLSETYCGSLSYAAPEVLKGTPYHPTCADMWSIGIILYTMLNKALPFNETSVKKMYEKQVLKKWRFRSSFVNDLSMEVKNLVCSLLEPEPCKRPTATMILHGPWISQDERLIKLTFLEEMALNQALEEGVKEQTENEYDRLMELRKQQRGRDGLKVLKAAQTTFQESAQYFDNEKKSKKK